MAKIITINIPETWLPAINKLVGNESIYPSRSELVREAIDKALTKVIVEAKNNTPKTTKPTQTEEEKIRRLVRESQEEARRKRNESKNP